MQTALLVDAGLMECKVRLISSSPCEAIGEALQRAGCGHLRPNHLPDLSDPSSLLAHSLAHPPTHLSMFRPTLAVLSKASRAPLTSKGGNKEYYKGQSQNCPAPAYGPVPAPCSSAQLLMDA